LISKAELARKAGISQLTIARVEKGVECRQVTMRKILTALGFGPWEREKVFPKK
jgi:predicted transcriptional regulator